MPVPILATVLDNSKQLSLKNPTENNKNNKPSPPADDEEVVYIKELFSILLSREPKNVMELNNLKEMVRDYGEKVVRDSFRAAIDAEAYRPMAYVRALLPEKGLPPGRHLLWGKQQ